jgi:hypothetical protein
VKRKFVLAFGSVGIIVAVLLGAVRLCILHYSPESLHGGEFGWLDTLTLTLWPSAFYLTVLQAKEHTGAQVIVWGLAIVFNAPIYGLVGWFAWRLSKAMNLVRG